jgi:hypothetical protein
VGIALRVGGAASLAGQKFPKAKSRKNNSENQQGDMAPKRELIHATARVAGYVLTSELVPAAPIEGMRNPAVGWNAFIHSKDQKVEKTKRWKI